MKRYAIRGRRNQRIALYAANVPEQAANRILEAAAGRPIVVPTSQRLHELLEKRKGR